MGDLAELLSRTSQMQVIVSREAGALPVSLYLRNVEPSRALEAACRSTGLCIKELDDHMYQIMTREESARGRQLYNDESVRVINIKYPAVLDLGETVRNLFADRVVWVEPSEENGDAKDAIDRALKRMDKLADRGQDFGGTGSDDDDDDDNDDDDDDDDDDENRDGESRVSTNVMRQLKTITEERREKMVAGNTDVRVGSDEQELGLVFVSAFPPTNTLLLRSSDEKALEQIVKVVADLDRPSPQVLLEVKVLEADVGSNMSTGIDWAFEAGDVSGTIENASGSTGLEPSLASLTTDAAGYNPRTAVFSAVTDHVTARLKAMQSEGRLVQLATPTLLVADNEASRVFIGSRSLFLKEVEYTRTRDDEGNVVSTEADPKIVEEEIGMSLLIAPRIHADRTLTLRVLQEETTFGQQRTIDYGTSDTISVQDINQRSVVSTIVAQDSNLVMIGGLIREKDSDRASGIPVLRSIPLVGRLFREKGTGKTRTELIILIRPSVLIAPGEVPVASMDLLKRISRHPSAKADIPDLGVELIPKPKPAKDEE
jgi:general secretion pathway protein D